MPVNRRYPLAALRDVLERHFPLGGKNREQFVVVEYIMLEGINDSVEDAHRWGDPRGLGVWGSWGLEV